MEPALFEEVGDIVRSLVPADLAELQVRPRRYGIKVWFGPVQPTRCHYEAQVVGPRVVPEAAALALEVGLHLEEPTVARNDEVLEQLLSAERRWRRALGPEPIAGPFLGRPKDWRRISEVWLDPDLGDDGLALDLATRLVDYVVALEPHRQAP